VATAVMPAKRRATGSRARPRVTKTNPRAAVTHGPAPAAGADRKATCPRRRGAIPALIQKFISACRGAAAQRLLWGSILIEIAAAQVTMSVVLFRGRRASYLLLHPGPQGNAYRWGAPGRIDLVV